MKITNVRVYGMEESMVAGGYPMMASVPSEEKFSSEVESIKHLLSYETFAKDFTEYQAKYNKWVCLGAKDLCEYCGDNSNVQGVTMEGVGVRRLCSKHTHQYYKYGKIWETSPKYELRDDDVKVTIVGDCGETEDVLISYADLPMFFYDKWSLGSGYCRNRNGKGLHRLILGLEDSTLVVDHINKDPHDNRRCNLRACTSKENSRNSSKHKAGENTFIGVSFDKSRNLWRAYINVDWKQIFLGRFETKRDAIVARLQAEALYFKEFSPQIDYFEEYGIDFVFEPPKDDSIIIKKALADYKRMCHLCQAPSGSGHDTVAKGLIVQFDCKAPRYWWNQLQRYHFIDIISSQSQVHRIGKLALDTNTDLMEESIELARRVVDMYNAGEINLDQCVANMPQGIEITARLTTNYLQLKTIYLQRRHHRSRHWQEFCDWIETLPYAKDFILPKEDKTNG